MNPKTPASVLDEIAQAQLPQDLNLLPGVLEKARRANRARARARLRVALAGLALLLAAALLFRPAVVRALQSLFGYLPGAGVVDLSSPLRALAQPVTDRRGDYELMVESAVLDSSRTVIRFSIRGDFPAYSDPAQRPLMCDQPPALRLPDGQELRYPRSEYSSGGRLSQWQVSFPALPAGVENATLILPCLLNLPEGEGPQDWQIPLAFAPAPPEMTVYPLVEMPDPTSMPQLAPTRELAAGLPLVQPSPTAATEESTQTAGMRLVIEGAAALPDGFALQARLHWQPDPSLHEVEIFPDAIRLLDSQGQDVPFFNTDQAPPFAPGDGGSIPLHLQTGPVLAPGTARLILDYVGVSSFASTSFFFETGSDPQPGQVWPVDQTLEINGYPVRVTTVEYMQNASGGPNMLMVNLEAGPEVLLVTAIDAEHEVFGPGGAPNNGFVPFRVGWQYLGGLPQGTITVTFTSLTTRRAGPWSAEWDPAAARP